MRRIAGLRKFLFVRCILSCRKGDTIRRTGGLLRPVLRFSRTIIAIAVSASILLLVTGIFVTYSAWTAPEKVFTKRGDCIAIMSDVVVPMEVESEVFPYGPDSLGVYLDVAMPPEWPGGASPRTPSMLILDIRKEMQASEISFFGEPTEPFPPLNDGEAYYAIDLAIEKHPSGMRLPYPSVEDVLCVVTAMDGVENFHGPALVSSKEVEHFVPMAPANTAPPRDLRATAVFILPATLPSLSLRMQPSTDTPAYEIPVSLQVRVPFPLSPP